MKPPLELFPAGADPIGPNPEPEPTEEKWTFSFGSTPIGSFTVKP